MPGSPAPPSFDRDPLSVSGSLAEESENLMFYPLAFKAYLVFEVGACSHLDVHNTGLVEVGQQTFKFKVVYKMYIRCYFNVFAVLFHLYLHDFCAHRTWAPHPSEDPP